jgi:transposase
MIGGTTCCPPSEGIQDPVQRRSDEASVASRGLFGSSSQAHREGKARRGCLRKGQEAIASIKKTLKKDAAEALVSQDEVEIQRHPTLSRIWGPVGKQPEIPEPGQNAKKLVYGGVDYATGKITYTIADSKCGMNFLIFLMALVKSYAGRKIRLVCNNGRFHHTRAIREWLQANSDLITAYWLPPYSPSLNLIERLWGHLKLTVLVNVLFKTLDELAAAFCKSVRRVNEHRNCMGFMFDHDDVLGKTG